MGSFSRDVAATATADLLRRYRNRSMVITAFVAPLLLALVLGWVLGGVSDQTFTIGVVDADRTAESRAITGALLGDPEGAPWGDSIEFRSISTAADAERFVRQNDLSAALVIPAGYAERLGSDPLPLLALRSPRRMVGGQVAESVAASVTEQVRRALLVERAATLLEVPAEARRAAVAEALTAPTPLPVSLADDEETADPTAYFAASMCIVFLFFTVSFAARSVMIDKENGMLDRLLSTPASLSATITGKGISVAFLGLAGFLGVWAVTAVAFSAAWGPAPAVLLLIVASVLAITGISLFVSSLGRTERQADAYATITTFLLALLGGNLVPIGSAPAAVRRLSLLTPNGWSLRGFSEVSAGSGIDGALVPAIVLAVFGAVAGAVGFARLRQVVGR